jgi:hypothetical protein
MNNKSNEDAIIDIIDHITIDFEDKVKESKKRGDTRFTLYSFQWAEDANSTHDMNGNKIIFKGNIHLSNILKYSYHSFIESLTKVLNKDKKDEYYCYHRQEFNGKVQTRNIYVSYQKIDNKTDFKKSSAPNKSNSGFAPIRINK